MPLKSCETWTFSGCKRHARCFHVVQSPRDQQICQPCSSLSFPPARRDKLAGFLLLSVV